MRRTQVLIGSMAAIILLLAAALAYTIGRQSSAQDKTSPANAVEAPAPDGTRFTRSAAQASGEKAPPLALDPHSDAELSQWIVGGWAEVSTNCETDTGDFYGTRGRYGNYSQDGTWRIENGHLIVIATHEIVDDLAPEQVRRRLPNPTPSRMRLIREGPNRMNLVVDGRPMRMMRCPEANHPILR